MQKNNVLPVIGVIGAGVIGCSVVQALVEYELHVILIDTSKDALDKAADGFKTWHRFSKLYTGKESQYTLDEMLSRLQLSTDYAAVANADLVIENVAEDTLQKQEVHRKLDAICHQECILAANTSCIPITMLASVTKRSDRFLGMHFMNPVPVKRLVEIIRGYNTSDSTIDYVMRFVSSIDREGIVVQDSPGFVSNRVMMLTINEAIFLLHEQVASAEDIDRIFKLGFAHKMGPLETADLIGLDTILNSIKVLYQSFSDSKYRPCVLLEKMVAAGLLGRKSGRGFYKYGN